VAYAAIETLLLEILRLETDRPTPEHTTRSERRKQRLLASAGRHRSMAALLRAYRRLRRR